MIMPISRIRTALAAAILAAVGASSGTASAQQAMPSGCEVKDASDLISILVCPTQSSQEVLALAGRAACGEQLPCGAWIYDDAEATEIPVEAPSGYEGLTQAQVTAAMAVWVAEQESLIVIGQTPRDPTE